MLLKSASIHYNVLNSSNARYCGTIEIDNNEYERWILQNEEVFGKVYNDVFTVKNIKENNIDNFLNGCKYLNILGDVHQF